MKTSLAVNMFRRFDELHHDEDHDEAHLNALRGMTSRNDDQALMDSLY